MGDACPMQGAVESLNVAVAGSVLAFEAVRQRGRHLTARDRPGDDRQRTWRGGRRPGSLSGP